MVKRKVNGITVIGRKLGEEISGEVNLMTYYS